MNILILFNLALGMSNLQEAKSTALFSGYRFEQTSSVEGVVTFEPTLARYRGQVKMIVVVDDGGYIETTKLQIKRTFVPFAREMAKAYLKQVAGTEDPVRFLGKQAHYESHMLNGTLLTIDEDGGWVTIFAGHNEGPKLGISFTSYKLK